MKIFYAFYLHSVKERDLNSIINRSFKKLGFSHKIADPMGGSGIQNPFDGFSVFNGLPWYWESKLIKNGYHSFNFKSIEDHQFSNLSKISTDLKDKCYTLIILGIYLKYKYFEVMMFDVYYIMNLISKGKNSLLQKELLKIRDKGYVSQIQNIDGEKVLTNLENLESRIIFKDYFID